MVDIPEHLLQRSAEARAKALGISIEQALAEMTVSYTHLTLPTKA